MTRPSDDAWSRGAVLSLGLLVAGHVGLAIMAVAGQPPDNPHNPVDVTALRQLGVSALAVTAALAFLVRDKPAFAVAAAVIAAAFTLLSPGPVLAVALVLLAAYVVGDLVLNDAGTDADASGIALALPCGLAIIIAALAALGTLPIHDGANYVTASVAIVAVRHRRVAALLQRSAMLLRGDVPCAALERAWIALLGVVVFLHVVVVARPEVGFDALAMHLQFVRLVAERHAWDYEVGRYVWGVMPLGADWLFAVGHALAGEAGARVANFAAALLAGWLLLRLVDPPAPSRWPALAVVTLFASAPLAYLLTGSLFSEALLCAFLLGTLVALRGWIATRSPTALIALAWCAAGALQCKAVAMLWVVPLVLGLLAMSRADPWRVTSTRHRALIGLAMGAAAWPYANAWIRTGNPVFPFMNGLFRSPLFATDASFNNALYNAPLLPWAPYEIVLASSRFLETPPDTAGAPGFQWLLVLPLVAVALAARRYTRPQRAIIALGAAFFALVWLQQSYLRYLLPALLVGGIAAGWALRGLAQHRSVGVIALLLGVGCIVANVRYIDTASWTNADVCRHCGTDAAARARYIGRYAPLRLCADWLNANLPHARVGFLLIGPSPAGYVGVSRAWNWHDAQAYRGFTTAYRAEDVLVQVRRWHLTHVVVPVVPAPLEEPMAAFGARYTRTLVEIGNYRIAEVVAPGGAAGDASAAAR